MRVEIELDGRTRDVTVERDPSSPGRFRVGWDGTTHLVDARVVERHAGSVTLSLVRLGDRAASHQARCVTTRAGGALFVHVAGSVFRAVVNGGPARFERGGGRARDGEERIMAPMPGKVVRVLVEPGAQVEACEPIVVVEAMKMENELGATRAGTVKELAVTEGAFVEAGRLLAIVE